MNVRKLSEELYGSARWLRVFTAQHVHVARDAVIRLASLDATEVRALVASGRSLLA